MNANTSQQSNFPILNKETLAQLPNGLGAIKYSESQCGTGIVHLGIGAFHRGHQAVYTHKMLERIPSNWRITAVSLRSAQVRDQLKNQDNLYTVIERSPETENAFVVGAIDRVLVAPENPQAVIDVLANPQNKVVTITVTEKGYCRDSSGENLNVSDPAIVYDLANIHSPTSLPGYIVAACKQRQMEGTSPLTIISCDNLANNGALTRTVVLDFARALDTRENYTGKNSLAKWIADNVRFCNSMVDRIVPAISKQEINLIGEKHQITDRSVIVTEPFKQWVIEDNFASERPPWDVAGAMFVDDVSQYEEMKLRLLNGAHSTLAYMGSLLGYEYIHQAVKDPMMNTFVNKLQSQLVLSLDDIPGINICDYAALIRERFANQFVPYKTSQVASDGSQKLPQRLLKPLESLIKAEQPHQHIVFVIAVWFRFLQGQNENEQSYHIVDPIASELQACAFEYKANISEQVFQLINISNIFGEYLSTNNVFIGTLEEHLNHINEHGLRNALHDLSLV